MSSQNAGKTGFDVESGAKPAARDVNLSPFDAWSLLPNSTKVGVRAMVPEC
ncbi:MAG: hypothetical protein O2960_29155 [Verrucomicrobia bacterium]|nr:hypothetical protein [Verrucomicrobiota bacterium]